MAAGLVSFIIPNYNHARYVRFAIDSALAQTHPQVEVIVIDDGSTDDSRSILAEYGARIRTIFQTNAGLSAARNAGIRVATGEYIALLDADDMVEAAYAERLVTAVMAQPGAAGAYCGFRCVDQNNHPLARKETRVVDPGAFYRTLLNGNHWVPACFLVRRDCYLAQGEFDRAVQGGEDWDMWLRFSRHYCLAGISDVLVAYRVVTGSMSSNPRQMHLNRLYVLKKHVGEEPGQAGHSQAHEAYANAYLRGAVEFFQFGDTASGYACLLKTACFFPPLLLEYAPYYELACSSQARGSEGQAGQLAVAEQQKMLLGLVDRLANEKVLGADGLKMKPYWQAQAL
jgi:glycosyltransferase involved in cell wall biosynthesis